MSFLNTPLFGVTITILAYAGSLSLYHRIRWLHPLFTTSLGIMFFLFLADIPYEYYKPGGDILVFFLGPATVALAVPLYKQFHKIKAYLQAIFAGVAVGSVTGIVTAVGLVALFHGTREIMLSFVPKSVTTPIAVEIIRSLGGITELGAVLTVLTGLLGSMFGPKMLRACGVKSDIALGAAMGTGSHGIGTARILRESELQGSVSGFAMGLAGILVSLMVIPIYYWFL